MKYSYIKEVNTGRLEVEIRQSVITVALDYTTAVGSGETMEVDIYFKAELSVNELLILDSIIEGHIPTPLPEESTKVEVINPKIETNSIGELILTWALLKSFYTSVSSVAHLNYIDLGEYYYIWISFRDQKMYVPILVKGTTDGTDFENNYKSLCFTPEDPRVRIATNRRSFKMHMRFVRFKTSSQDDFDNTDFKDVCYGDIVYSMMESVSGTMTLTEDFNKCDETWIDWTPLFSYEVYGGTLNVPAILDGDDEDKWEVHVVGAPDIPESHGGTVHFVANPALKFYKDTNFIIAECLSPSYVPHIPGIPTTRIRFIMKHPRAAVSEFQLSLKYFK